MRKSAKRVIDGLEFEVHQMNPRPAQRLSVRIAGHLAGPIGQALTAMKLPKGGSLADLDIEPIIQNLGKGVPDLASRLSPEEVEAIQAELFQTAWLLKEGKRIPMMEAWDIHLESPFTAMKVAMLALEVNFASFFGGALAGRIAQLKARAASSQASDTSPQNGPSGG